MILMKSSKKRWFVYDTYEAAGRPKAEEAVMKYARANYLGALIAEDKLEEVRADIEAYCKKILEENRRLAPVKIVLSKTLYWDDICVIFVGQQSLRLKPVKITIE